MGYRRPDAGDWGVTALYLFLTLALVAGTGALLARVAGSAGLVVWIVVLVPGSLWLLARWHAKHTAYRCGACGRTFEIGICVDLASPHTLGKKYLTCPHCGDRGWARVLMKED